MSIGNLKYANILNQLCFIVAYYELKGLNIMYVLKMNSFHTCRIDVGLSGAVCCVSMDVPLKHTVLWEWLDNYMHHFCFTIWLTINCINIFKDTLKGIIYEMQCGLSLNM